MWAHRSGIKIHGFSSRDKDIELFSIDSEAIDPSALNLAITLVADVPTDRQQKVATAIQLASGIPGFPIRAILEELGVTDAEGYMEEWTKEQFQLTMVEARKQKMMAVESEQLQQLAQQLAMQMIQEQNEQAAAEGSAAAGPGGPGPGGPGPGAEGPPLFDPNQGNLPPATNDPAGTTREAVTGQTRGGAQVGGSL
jgi:hypothetical protein